MSAAPTSPIASRDNHPGVGWASDAPNLGPLTGSLHLHVPVAINRPSGVTSVASEACS